MSSTVCILKDISIILYMWNESLWINLSFNIKSVLMYRRTHLIQSDEVGISVVLYCHCIKSVTDSHFVSHGLFIYYLNWMGMTSEIAVRENW